MSERFCPYQGLLPYMEGDREYFFGRDEEQETIAANLLTAPLTIFYGASGVGKTSVLMAGVVPRLRQMEDVAVVVYRSWQDADPVRGLKAAVLAALVQKVGEGDGDPGLDPALPLDEYLLRAGRILGGPILLILDQFEEYFLYHSASSAEDGFEVGFARSVNRYEVDANFLISMREDGLSKLDRFQGRIPNLLTNMLRLEHLDRDGAVCAIRKPLEVYNSELPAEQQRFEIEDRLVDAVVDQVQAGCIAIGREQGGGPVDAGTGSRRARRAEIETPFLQMVLLRLWKEEAGLGSRTLRWQTLEDLGRAQQIVRTHLDEKMRSLSPAEREVAAGVFHFLVTPSGAKIAYVVEDLATYAQMPVESVHPVLEKLCGPEFRILRKIPPPSGQPTISRFEIFHDVLAAAILDWRTRYHADKRVQRAEQELARERAEAGRQLAWMPWLVGFVLDLFLCIVPAGAFFVVHRLRRKLPDARRQQLAWVAIGWVLGWGIGFVLTGLIGLQLEQTEQAEASLISIPITIFAKILGPLGGWLAFRRAFARGLPVPLAQPAASSAN